MIRLYSASSPNSRKVEIALRELGLDYEDRPVDVRGGEQFEEHFVRLCPNSKIPVLDDDGQRVWESGAILLYLAERYDTREEILSRESTARWNAIQLTFFQAAGLGPNLGRLSSQLQRPADDRNAEMIEIFATEVERILAVVDRVLETSGEHLAGRYSIADIMHYPWLQPVRALEAPQLMQRARIVEWLDRIAQRPAVQATYGFA